MSLVEFFGKIRLTDTIQDFMPFRLSSPNAIPPTLPKLPPSIDVGEEVCTI
jgi:hypothetical protein